MISKGSAFKIFFFGWHLSKFETIIRNIKNYLENPVSTDNYNSIGWWLPLLEETNMKKDFIHRYPEEFSVENIIFFLIKDLNNSRSALSYLYTIREYTNGTLPLDIYNQLHKSIENIKELPDYQMRDSLSFIIEDIIRDINSVIGTLTIHTEYMHDSKK